MLSDCDYLIEAADKSKHTVFSTAWEQAVLESAERLEAADRRLLASVGGIIGNSDIETQTGQLSLVSEQLESLLKDARASCEKNRKLSTALGSLLGLAIAVILF